MALNITIGNNGTGGTIPTYDSVVGLMCTGTSEGDYTLGDPILITGMASLNAAGITADNNAFAYRQVNEFYKEAGDGAQLYLMLTSTATSVYTMALHTNVNGVVKLLDYAQGDIKVVGLVTLDSILDDEVVINGGLNEDCYDAMAALQLTLDQYAAKQQPARGVIGCTSYNDDQSDLTDLTEDSSNRVAMLLGDTISGDADGAAAAVGLLLGRVAKSKVHQKISRVRTGKLKASAAYVGTTVVDKTSALPDFLKSRGFITLRGYPEKAGYFFASDVMATATTDDYRILARGRVIDKAHRITYKTYIDDVEENIELNADGTGTMKSTFIATLKNRIENAINNTLGKAKEISGVTADIPADQDVEVSEEVIINLGITPVGYAGTINVTLGFQA